ncbi:haloacid dehalogenase-like hydrolase [Actinomycetospora succinea]|uniref:Haloacid dehalogenase-like hydrolase n=1 Tax=Actinomycetospora succinea TaxID=663603 RepID=A0A4R6VT19_9PSEU|nr:HAD family hydrolase [Actinomycetospora succinea]TDQ63080.1 haloacid dehalogenase-like hydrolase [Actinomycetospora succinea]
MTTPPFPAVVFDLDGTLTVSGTTRPAPGVVALVEALHARGVDLAVATSASTAVARRVLDDLGVRGCFASVAGRGIDGRYDGKDAVVGEALLGLGVTEAAPGTPMLGDGPGDMAAAVARGLVPVGVGWGGASEEALRAAGAVVVLRRPDELWSLGAS